MADCDGFRILRAFGAGIMLGNIYVIAYLFTPLDILFITFSSRGNCLVR
jgi:hypothetical protein